jgi:uncharacterized damage-inducible protein DinB
MSRETGRSLSESFAINERMNQLVIEHLDPRAWRAKLPGARMRTIADIFSHVHNVRLKWLRLSMPHLKRPAALSRTRCTPEQARAALAESGARCCEMLAESQTFLRDALAKPWQAGPAMLAYMITHDAHHRGQVCLVAHQLGYPLKGKGAWGIWMWERLAKDCGATRLG